MLSLVAGYVDSCTYLGLFGIFVAQVTGSLVLVGTELVKKEPVAPEKLLAIPSFFFAGVAVSLLIHSIRDCPRAALARSLAIEWILLIGFLASCLAGIPFRGLDAPAAIVALLFGMAAMGAQSAPVHLQMQGVTSQRYSRSGLASSRERHSALRPTSPSGCPAHFWPSFPLEA
ncbi:DUF1275 family protein [Bradyrhizobium sp. UFLA05-112]